METHENIKRLREKFGMSQEELAQRVGYKDRSSIAKIESGKIDIAQSKIAAFAEVFNVTPAYLMGIEDNTDTSVITNIIPMPSMRQVPLLGSIACGDPILAIENIEDNVDIPEHIHADFALRCKGDSMINARIFDGDIVYIRQQSSVENGEIAAVLIDDEATLKRVVLYSDHISLEPENPNYRPRVFWDDDMNNVRILGKAVAFTSAI